MSPDGASVYVAAPGRNALDTFTRDASNGSLSQASNGTGCIPSSSLTGCTLGTQLGGADAVVTSPNGAGIYVTSLQSNTVTVFTRTSSGQSVQLSGTSACVVNVLAVGCSLARELNGPEGLAVSPDGASLYAAAYTSGALDVMDRNTSSGTVIQKPRVPGCLVQAPSRAACRDAPCSARARSPPAPTARTSTRRRSRAAPSASSGASPKR